jgi:hypothetical protein
MTRVALLLLLCLPVVAAAQPKPPKPEAYDSEAGKFSVEAPGKPEVEARDIAYGPNPGQTIRRTLAKWPAPRLAGTTFSVTFADYPESFAAAPPKTLLDAAREGLRGPEGLGGSVEVDKPAELKDADGKTLTGRAVTVKARKNWVRARLVVVGTRLYEVMVTGPEDGVTDRRATEFLDSFRLTK